MKLNNRNFDTMQTENCYNNDYVKGEMLTNDYGFGMGACCRPEMMNETMPGVVCPPVYECPRETVCHRYICHEVPHIMPCNTRIINHHIYRHTYTPTYSCCEENEVQNVYERRCC